ncbi:WD40/YVTN/BNR-like repeat-containing protein [Thermoanaerobacter mathranii]|uniref:WD40/YVTN/BNR-like repeat-containing protein n=1 Tax=Thermoanaerobacter mathranii TaxID=583357 RepID=UPI003AAB23BB
MLGGCTTTKKPNNTINDEESKSSITNSNQLKVTIYSLPQKPELKVFWINGNEVLTQSSEPFKTGTTLYSSSNFRDFSVKSKILESDGYYYPDPNNRKLLFFISFTSKGQTRIWKSQDGGKSWRRVFKEPVNSLTFHPTQMTTIYAVNENHKTSVELYVSQDQGETWVKHAEITGAYLVNQIAVNPKNPQHMLAGARNGLWFTSDNGNHWINLFDEAEPTNIVYNPINPKEAYFIGHDKVFRVFDNKITKIGEYGSIYSLVFKPNSGTAYFLSEDHNINIYAQQI